MGIENVEQHWSCEISDLSKISPNPLFHKHHIKTLVFSVHLNLSSCRDSASFALHHDPVSSRRISADCQHSEDNRNLAVTSSSCSNVTAVKSFFPVRIFFESWRFKTRENKSGDIEMSQL